jgi:hypothetical protein
MTAKGEIFLARVNVAQLAAMPTSGQVEAAKTMARLRRTDDTLDDRAP